MDMNCDVLVGMLLSFGWQVFKDSFSSLEILSNTLLRLVRFHGHMFVPSRPACLICRDPPDWCCPALVIYCVGPYAPVEAVMRLFATWVAYE